MYGIVWRYLPRGSWIMSSKIYNDKEKAEAVVKRWCHTDTHAKAIYLGDPEDWK